MNYTKTRIAFLGYTEVEPNSWSYIHIEDGRNASVGAIYASEKDLLADLSRYASTWGNIGPEDEKVQEGEVLVRTTASIGFDVKLDMLPFLTDRWGELIASGDDNSAYQAARKALSDDPVLFERLQAMMSDELTFIARKGDQYGVLFEMEYMSAESEEGKHGVDVDSLPSELVMFERLAGYASQLEEMFPGQQFVVPTPSLVYDGRPALWTFVPLDGATPELLDAIAEANLDFAYGKLPEASPVASRIPSCDASTPEGMRAWFDAMEELGLLFHPDDSPSSVVSGLAGERVFTNAEAVQLTGIMAELHEKYPDTIHATALAASGYVGED